MNLGTVQRVAGSCGLRTDRCSAIVRGIIATSTGDAVELRLTAAFFTLESAYGSVRSSKKPEDFDEIARRVKDAKAEGTGKKMREA